MTKQELMRRAAKTLRLVAAEIGPKRTPELDAAQQTAMRALRELRDVLPQYADSRHAEAADDYWMISEWALGRASVLGRASAWEAYATAETSEP